MMMLRQLRDRLVPAAAQPPLQAAPAARAEAPRPNFTLALGRDQLTGLPNRACFTYLLAGQAALSAQFETELTVLTLDWAGYGAAGAEPARRDQRLADLAAHLRAALQRKHDVLGSLGNGRLAALLPFTDAAGASRVARSLQAAARDVLQRDLTLPAMPEGVNEDAARPFGRSTAAPDEASRRGGGAEAEADTSFLSVGMATYCGKGQLDHETLLRAAEQAVAVSGLEGGGRLTRFAADGRPDL